MGEIADMHVEALQAGLDPNEMDGADWADFYGVEEQDEPYVPAGEDISITFRCFVMTDFLAAAHEGESLVSTVCRLYPNVTEGQARGFQAFVEAINGFPEDDD